MTVQKVFNNLDQLLPPGTKTIVVAVSGGADSMALTLLAKEYANEKGYTLLAVTVDHSLRPESAEEALWVQQTLQGQGICHQTLVWHHDEDLNRRHERARAARYQLMLDFCKKHSNSVLLTAHHQQDQVETILMRFLHGSGPAGFQGIQRLRFQDGIPIARPLLNVSPQELRAYLENKAIDWVEDPSNVNAAYERTRVRQLLEGIAHDWGMDGILASAAKIYDAQSTMDEIVDGYAKGFVISDADVDPHFHPLSSPLPPLSFPRRQESITVNQSAFFKCPEQIQRQWLRKQIWQIGGAAYPKPYKTIDAILKILKQPKVNGYKVAGCVINVSKRKLHLKGQ